MFSGIGGFELGIQQAADELGIQAECIGYSEIDKAAIRTYEEHFNHDNYGDATTINANTLPEFDLLVGGFPCQPFSIAGGRAGFADVRGTLFFDIVRIIKAKEPQHFILENVKGLINHNHGQTFRTIISTLDELGYDLQWQVLNSRNHGVPQNRERVYIVGNLGGTPRPAVFPLQGRAGNHQDLPLDPRFGVVRSNRKGSSEFFAERPIANTIDANYAKGLDNHGSRTGVVEGGRIRRLTPTECERLQGFPDGWTIGADTQRYKQCGNAVTVNVVRDVALRLLGSTMPSNSLQITGKGQ
jgi:DNA (cytosine-5)-methyltransferase 1